MTGGNVAASPKHLYEAAAARYGMAWYGMVWCGMVWYGMVEVCEGAPVVDVCDGYLAAEA